MIQAYLDKKAEGRNIGLLITVMMVGACLMGLIVAAMVAWGWDALGRARRYRALERGLNTYEHIVSFASLIYALCAGRTLTACISANGRAYAGHSGCSSFR